MGLLASGLIEAPAGQLSYQGTVIEAAAGRPSGRRQSSLFPYLFCNYCMEPYLSGFGQIPNSILSIFLNIDNIVKSNLIHSCPLSYYYPLVAFTKRYG